jgi:hypothetical protein
MDYMEWVGIRLERSGVSQARYGLSENSSVPLVGGRLVDVEINIVTVWGM